MDTQGNITDRATRTLHSHINSLVSPARTPSVHGDTSAGAQDCHIKPAGSTSDQERTCFTDAPSCGGASLSQSAMLQERPVRADEQEQAALLASERTYQGIAMSAYRRQATDTALQQIGVSVASI